jgi:chromosome partitioning protein
MDINQFKITRKFLCDILEVATGTMSRRIAKYENELKGHGTKVPLKVARQVIKESYSKNHSPKKQIQCFFNFKGGTGKTTITYNIAFLLYLFGYKILVIDCDAQGHLTKSILEGSDSNHVSIFEVLAKSHQIGDAIINVMPEFDLIPSSVKISFVDSLLSNQVRREEVLKDILSPLRKQYDFIFFDVNPSLSVLNRNVLVVSDRVNIISEAQPFSFQGMEMLLQEFDQLSKVAMNSKIDYRVLINKLEPKLKSNIDIVNALQDNAELKNKLFENAVRKCDDFNFSSKNQIPIPLITNKNNSNAKEDILQLGKEMLIDSCAETVNKEVRDAA